MESLKLFLYLMVFLFLTRHNGYTHYFKYSPTYNFADDAFYSKISQHSSKGIIILNNVQMTHGLSLQVATKKQYFQPREVILKTSGGHEIDLHCTRTLSASLGPLDDQFADCFIKRSKEEWEAISKILDVNLVMTDKKVNLVNLKLIDQNEYFNLYEI